MPELLELCRLGNPVLREACRTLSPDEIRSVAIQSLIADIRHTNKIKQYGVGLAAPQVGKSVALSVIGIKPTPNRPELEPFESVIINPKYEGVGETTGMWEGCQSIGEGDNILFGQAARYPTIHATWYDEDAKLHEEKLSGFVAQVFQHETDHLAGIVFLDRVADTHTFMMSDEYRKRIVGAGNNSTNGKV
jgi:peptide deformylase